jgi:hypothetical protein
MRTNESKGRTVMVVGGSGGMSHRYREVLQRRGWTLRHFETSIPANVRRSAAAEVALIIVMVTMVSHVLRDQARELASNDAQVVYLHSASVSALRAAVEQWEAA